VRSLQFTYYEIPTSLLTITGLQVKTHDK